MMDRVSRLSDHPETRSSPAGPIRFVAVLLNTLIILGSLSAVLLSSFGGAQYLLFYLVADIIVSLLFVAYGGILREIGRGMVIAWLSLPIGMVVIAGGFAVGHAIVGR